MEKFKLLNMSINERKVKEICTNISFYEFEKYTEEWYKNKDLKFIINAQYKATKNIFKLKKIPFREISFDKKNEDELGRIFTFFVLETILLSRLMNVNPFDQPAVEQVKIETEKFLRQ